MQRKTGGLNRRTQLTHLKHQPITGSLQKEISGRRVEKTVEIKEREE